MNEDRTIHAYFSTPQGRVDVVRYDRAGKWFYETKRWRKHISVGSAARLVVENAGFVYFGRPGGSAFERAVLELRKDAA